MRVLLVEDERHMAEAIAQVLKKHNYSVDRGRGSGHQQREVVADPAVVGPASLDNRCGHRVRGRVLGPCQRRSRCDGGKTKVGLAPKKWTLG
jgi:hypothetical protein